MTEKIEVSKEQKELFKRRHNFDEFFDEEVR